MIPALAESLAASTDRARLLFIISRGDVSVLDEVHGAHDCLLVPQWDRCDYARKINAGIAASDEPLIFTGAIDLLFRPGWLEAAEAHLSDTVGVVGTNDLTNPRVVAGRHATHFLVSRHYVNRGQIDGEPGLLHEGYWHEYVDDELVATATFRGAYAFAEDSHVEHLAWQWGKRPADTLDADMNLRMNAGRRLFRRRRHLWA